MISALTDYKTPVMCDQAMTDASELSHYILPGGCTASGLDGKFLVDSHIKPPRLSTACSVMGEQERFIIIE